MTAFGAEAAVRPTGPIAVQTMNNALSYSNIFCHHLRQAYLRPALSFCRRNHADPPGRENIVAGVTFV
jgi:hypothetical protein